MASLHGTDESELSADSGPQTDEQQKEDVASDFQTGGFTQFRTIDEEISRVVKVVEEEIKHEIKQLIDDEEEVNELEIVGYRMNVVAGYMYYVKIKIPGGNFIYAKILQTPSGEITLQNVHETKTDEDEKEYFKLP